MSASFDYLIVDSVDYFAPNNQNNAIEDYLNNLNAGEVEAGPILIIDNSRRDNNEYNDSLTNTALYKYITANNLRSNEGDNNSATTMETGLSQLESPKILNNKNDDESIIEKEAQDDESIIEENEDEKENDDDNLFDLEL
jgi:hypothetical protein